MIDSIETLTLFAKIVVAIGAICLLFVDQAYVTGPSVSIVTEACFGVTFVALLVVVSVWDSTLAVLTCILAACWISAIKRRGRNDTVAAESAQVSAGQAAAMLSRQSRDNDNQYMQSVGTKYPTSVTQAQARAGPPMAFTMADRTYSGTAL